jgi:hypothetical protein
MTVTIRPFAAADRAVVSALAPELTVGGHSAAPR